MRTILTLFAFCLFVAACADLPIDKECKPRKERKANKHLNKALQACEPAVRNRAAIMYPPKDSISREVEYRQGEPELIVDTLVIVDTVTNTVTKVITRNTNTTDTIRQVFFKNQVNTAEVLGLQAQVKLKEKAIAEKDIKISKQGQVIKWLWVAICILGGYLVLRWILRLKIL